MSTLKEKFATLNEGWKFLATVVTVLFLGGAAWGQSQLKIQSLEEAVKSNATTVKEVQELKIQNARIEEQVKTLKENQLSRQDLAELLNAIRDKKQHFPSTPGRGALGGSGDGGGTP